MNDPVKQFDARMLEALVATARETPRGRAHHNVHQSLEAPVQRLFIALEPRTYIPPHRHLQPPKWEFLLLVSGALDLLIFDDHGRVWQRLCLSPTETRAVELPAGTWHTYDCRASGTVVLEIKEGPYTPTPDEDFAPWAPRENDPAAAAFREALRAARPGKRSAAPPSTEGE